MLEEYHPFDEKPKKVSSRKLRKAVLIFLVFVVFLLALIKVIIPGIKYNSARKLFNTNDYSSAASIFNSINYKDSNEKAKESYYFAQKDEIKDVKRGDVIKFGLYEQDNNKLNGLEEIEWKVLYVDGNKALIISEYGLDCMQYNSTRSPVTWESCTLRTWLNDSFINIAFSKSHQELIELTIVSTEKNPHYDADTGKDSTDKVFLLSISEANTYFYSDSDRVCVPTEYAVSKRAFTKTGSPRSYWWLRSPGNGNELAATVVDEGFVYTTGEYVDADVSVRNLYGYSEFDHNICVRPAMWINIK